ncbi:uncharacterized protein [Arachis hypogaea]|uniref:uncharacterized protein n=1 Tax=Arachis hypogaea TaxID=3818 RepID=UPI000DECCDA2|nr:uncharacterized protein LOC112789533 [Arachis hypogaea]QHO56105.1 uncharacterized protein DS421_3g70850 [Arachis hypogaea]
MEGTTNLVVYRDGEIIRNTHEGVRFVSQNPFSFVVPCTMTFMELQNGLCQSMENGTLMRVSRILYRNPVVVFGGLIQFDTMPITDEVTMHNMFQIHRQTQMRQPHIELYVEFETVEAEGIQNELEVEDDRAAVYEGMNSDSEEDFEATYEAGDEDEDGDVGVEKAAHNVVVHPSISQPMNVPPFMRELDLDAMHAPEFPEYSNIGVPDPEDGEFRIGVEYSSRKSVVAAIRSYTIARGVDYEVYESEPQTFYAKCKMYGRGCDWLIRASVIRKKGCWEIRRYNGRHTCTTGVISQDHSKLDSDTVAEAIRPLVETDPSIKVKTIIAEVQSRFNYTISYRKAWLAKQKSIANVFGDWEESYQALPWWLSVMVQKIPGSVVQIETRPLYNGNEEAQGVKILHRVFWSFNPCVRAFRHCKPLVQVDGTHLYGKYKGTLLVAVAQDGNQNIVPIAFALVEGETADAWHFFLRNLRMHVVRKDGVGMISDRHESIRAAVNRSGSDWQPPRAWWMFCIRHIGSNFLRAFKVPHLQKLVVNIGYSRTVEEYNINYKRLEERGEAYARWCDAIGLRHWVLAFDEGHRWGHMTTNLVECINSVLKGARNLPVLALVRATYYRLNELFVRKSAESYERKRAGHTYSVFAQQRIEASMQQAGNIVVHRFDRRNEVFEVREMTSGKVLVVDLARRTFDCGHFQVERIPCRHVIACCANQRIDWHVYVHDVYKMSEVRKVYKFEFSPLGDAETWPPYEGPTLVANPALRRTSKGRPKLTRYLNEMDSRDMRGPRICRLCGAQGHSRSRCPQRAGSSGGGE